MHRTAITAFLASAFALAAGGTARAQAEPAAEPGEGLADIIVTTQRRAEQLQSVPIAVTAITGAELEQAGIQDITRLDVLTPGLTVGQSGSDARPALRGVKTDNSRQAVADSPVAFYIDDIYQSANQEQLASLVDVARVEVQRGPQGTLYGRNSFGGNIAYFSNLPGPEFGGFGTVQYGAYNEVRFEGAVNVPIDPTLALRVAGLHETNDGYVDNAAPAGNRAEDKDTNFVRLSARWNPTEDFEAVLRASYLHEGGDGSGAYEYKVGGTLVNPARPFLANGQLNESIYGVPIAINPRARAGDEPSLSGFRAGVPIPSDPWTEAADYPGHQRIEGWAPSLTLTYNLGDVATIKSITAYNLFNAIRYSDGDFSQYALRWNLQDSHNETTTQELQVSSAESHPYSWIVGYYFLHTNAFEKFQQYFIQSSSFGSNNRTYYNTTSHAGFAQGSYDILPNLRATAGFRYTADTKTSSGSDFVADTSVPSQNATFYRATWHGSVDWTPIEDKLLYASVSTGFRSGGYNTGITSPLPPTFGPEKVNAYEIGAKTRWLDKRLQVNVSAFYNDFSSLQIVGFDPNTFLTYTVNAGQAYARGVELEIDAQPVRGMNVVLTGAYLDARYSQFKTVDPISYAGFFTGNGNQIAMSPDWRFGAQVDYTYDLKDYGTLTPLIDTHFSSPFFLLDYNTPIEKQKSYTQTDLRLTWTHPDGRLSAEAFVENIENAAVKGGGEFGGRGAFFIGYLPPRTWGLQLGYKF